MQSDIDIWINGVWLALGVIWLIGALVTKRTARVQTSGSRLIQLGLTAAGFFLVLQPDLDTGFLGYRFLPQSSAAAYLGFALTVCGAALAVSARVILGKNWSATVTIKQD